MKKHYIKPELEMFEIHRPLMQSLSGGEKGNKDDKAESSKFGPCLWDEDNEEEENDGLWF